MGSGMSLCLAPSLSRLDLVRVSRPKPLDLGRRGEVGEVMICRSGADETDISEVLVSRRWSMVGRGKSGRHWSTVIQQVSYP